MTAKMFVNLCPVSKIESIFDEKLFAGVTVWLNPTTSLVTL
jgi:hypothetical protein